MNSDSCLTFSSPVQIGTGITLSDSSDANIWQASLDPTFSPIYEDVVFLGEQPYASSIVVRFGDMIAASDPSSTYNGNVLPEYAFVVLEPASVMDQTGRGLFSNLSNGTTCIQYSSDTYAKITKAEALDSMTARITFSEKVIFQTSTPQDFIRIIQSVQSDIPQVECISVSPVDGTMETGATIFDVTFAESVIMPVSIRFIEDTSVLDSDNDRFAIGGLVRSLTGKPVYSTNSGSNFDEATIAFTEYTYNANGSLQRLTYPDGSREDYTYTVCGQVETLTNRKADSTIIDAYTYTYDAAHNLTQKTDSKGSTFYTYDASNRLLTVTEPSGKVTAYTFDGAGNRATQTVTVGTDVTVTSYSYDALNRLTLLEKTLNTVLYERQQYTYDNNGNQLLTTRTTFTDGIPGTPVITQQNTYDLRNQLTRTVTENGTIVENVYNGDGLRVEKIVNGTATFYLYEYQRVVLEQNSLGDVTGRNIYGTNLLMRTVGVDAFFYMYNAHADVTALLSTSGVIIGTYYYDAFGNILEQTGDTNNSILFAGYQYDAETGMYYLNARMYDPVTARFMQEDTYTGQNMDPLSLNLYTYCHNEPLMYSDPTGHSRVGGSKPRVREPFSPPVKLKRDKSVVKSMVEEKEKQTKEAQRTHNRYDTIGSYLKSNPVFAEQDYVQLTMEQAGNMGADAYLAEMEKYMADYVRYKPGENFEEWKEKQIQPNMNFIPTDEYGKAAEIWAMKKDQKNYAMQRADYVLGNLENPLNGKSLDNEYASQYPEIIAELYAYNDMTEFQEELFWEALEWLGTDYLLNSKGPMSNNLIDCSGFVGKVYESLLPSGNNFTHSAQGMVKYGEEVTGDLEVGDMVFYELTAGNGRNPDHVGLFMGYLANGDPIIIDASSTKTFGEVVIRSIGLNGNSRNFTNGSSDVINISDIESITNIRRYIDQDGNQIGVAA